ncbi:anti-sigma factor [Blastococcus sp. CT_GayMR16]|uniref:anti-sigma factor n=1 Tax=Blastococcus sp. CT_GayMR16 TaxID=2559607 RepID=UPI001FD7EE53|nr:anti-sigma factor [Blastococcus sp. CT_GayMR16]
MPEQLALAALREPLPAEDAAHLDSCGACAAEVASLQRAVDAVAVPLLAAPGAPVEPPAHVWDAIAAATGVPAAATGVPAAADPPAGAEIVPFRARRRPLLLVAASVLVGAVVGAGAVAVLRDSDDGVDAVQTVALDPLDENDASGRAEVVVRDDGSRALEVQLTAPALDDGYYEVWLIEPSITDMVPLGIARSGTQTFELPADLDLGEFPVVDVSVEPLDGDPLHSGVSVARGQLES